MQQKPIMKRYVCPMAVHHALLPLDMPVKEIDYWLDTCKSPADDGWALVSSEEGWVASDNEPHWVCPKCFALIIDQILNGYGYDFLIHQTPHGFRWNDRTATCKGYTITKD